MRQRSLKQTESGRIPKKIDFEPAVYRKAEAIIKNDPTKPTLKSKLSNLIVSEHKRIFGTKDRELAAK